MRDEIIAALLGIVEGVTEFIPVSSTGHLILFGDIFSFRGEVASVFEVFIQSGAILAVLALYWKRFIGLIPFKVSNSRGFEGWQGIGKLAAASAPAFLSGALLHSAIKSKLFYPMPVAFALVAGGIVLILVEKRKTPPTTISIDDLSYLQAFMIGVGQCASLWPGVSRSAATIIAGLLCGLDRKVAAEFSFLVAVPVMFAATAYDLYKSSHLLSAEHLPIFGIGFLVSFLVALLAVRIFISLLNRIGLTPFGWYRIALGAAVLIWL